MTNGAEIVSVICACITAAGVIVAAVIARGVKKSPSRQQMTNLESDVFALTRYIYRLKTMLAERGIQAPPMPRLKSVPRAEEWQ